MSSLRILSIGERWTVGASSLFRSLAPKTPSRGETYGKATRDKGFETLKALETALPPRARPPPSLYSRRDTVSGRTNTLA
eukprot:scaffold19910_cov145-Isochrysis_galbana.AAC.1